MSVDNAIEWQPADFCIDATHTGITGIEKAVYDRVCRTDFRAPGFCLIDLGAKVDSASLRRAMLDLKTELAKIHFARSADNLVYFSAGRFDQQETTKLHRDGGPEESILMLGYEPSEVRSHVAMADYSRCAADQGMTPAEFLDQFNPMFAKGEQLLRPYTTTVACFQNRQSQILLINNSIAAPEADRWQGVLHTATILNPDPNKRRVVNSTMIAAPSAGNTRGLTEADIANFLTTTTVRRRGYDKLNAQDDE